MAPITGNDIEINTKSASNNGAVNFSGSTSTVNTSVDNAAKTLTILSGSGKVTFDGVIGGTANKHLGGLSVNSSSTDSGDIEILAIGTTTDPGVDGGGNVALGTSNTNLVTFDGVIYNVGTAGGITVAATSGTGGNSSENISFTGADTTVKTANGAIQFNTAVIDTTNALTINSVGGAISINSVMGSGTAKALTVNANSGDTTADATETITIGAIGNANEIGAVALTAADGVTLSGDITLANAAGADLTVTGAAKISGTVVIDVDNSGDGHEDGTVSFSTTIDGVAGDPADNLTINFGDAANNGTISLGGTIGTVPLASLNINASAGSGIMTIPAILATGNNAGVTGAVNIGNATSGDITFSGTGANAYNIGGALTVKSDGGADAFQFTGTNTVLTATGGIAFVSADGADGIEIADNKELTLKSTDTNISLTTVAGVDGNTGEDLTIEIVQSSGGGEVTIAAVGTDMNDVVITAPTINLQGDITTSLDPGTDAGDTSDDDAASIDLNGAVVIDGATRTLTSGNGTIDFSSTVNSKATEGRGLTIVSGTGAVAFNGAIGTATTGGAGTLGALTVNSGTDTGTITFATAADVGTATAAGASSIIVGGTGTTTLAINGAEYFTTGNQEYEAASTGSITMGGTNPDFHASADGSHIKFIGSGGGDIVLADTASLTVQTNNGLIDIAPQIKGTADGDNTNVTLSSSGADGTGTIVLDNTGGAVIGTDIGNVALTGGTITVSHNIETDAGGIDIDGAFVLNKSAGTITVTSGTTGGGNIDFDSTIRATTAAGNAESLTIINGSGTVGIGGIIGGGTKPLKALNIAASAATDTGAVTIKQIGADASTAGATTVTIGHTGNDLGSITFSGSVYTSSDDQTYIADGYSMTAADPVFTAAAKDITFTDAGSGSLVLADIADLTLSSAGAGNIDVQVAIAGTADGDSSGDDATDVTINAGDGTVSIEGIGTDINLSLIHI